MKWDDEDLDLALHELRDEELPASALTRIRTRVLTQVQWPRAKWWHWAWVPVLAAALAVVAMIPRDQPPVEPPPLIAKAPSAQPLVRPAASARRRIQPAPPAAETQFARILTDDPNVVILWAMTTKGDSQ